MRVFKNHRVFFNLCRKFNEIAPYTVFAQGLCGNIAEMN